MEGMGDKSCSLHDTGKILIRAIFLVLESIFYEIYDVWRRLICYELKKEFLGKNGFCRKAEMRGGIGTSCVEACGKWERVQLFSICTETVT